MMKLKISISLLLLISFSVLRAQSISVQSDTIEWTINGLNDLNADVTVPYECKFITIGGQSLDWIQEDGKFTMHFSITEATGNWDDAAQYGSISFTVSGEGLTGQFTISRSGDGLKGALNLSGGTYPINHTYPIESYEKL